MMPSGASTPSFAWFPRVCATSGYPPKRTRESGRAWSAASGQLRASAFTIPFTPDSARACPDFQPNVGDGVNDVESTILIGAYRFPGNVAITALDAGAKARAARRDVLDTASFGR